MSSITTGQSSGDFRTRSSLQVLGAYIAVAGLSAVTRFARGTGSPAAVAAYVVLAIILAMTWQGRGPVARGIGAWLPLLAMPTLYWSLPSSMVYGDGRLFDAMIQSWDRALFGMEPARIMAGSLPYVALSEILHAAYMSYYAIIYVPPLLMYLSGATEDFKATVLAFTIVMCACFLVFLVMPVAGPRYQWAAPAGVPDGPMRSLATVVLQRGSSRGTAFPSSHMAIALAMSLSSIRWRRGFGAMVAGLTVLLGVGAVYGGFHYAADVLVGAMVGVVGWRLMRAWSGLDATKAEPA